MDMTRLGVANPFSGAPVYYRAETDSTMSDAAGLSRADSPAGTVIVAGHQTAGRGRFRNRRWESNTGDSLLLTLILDKGVLVHPIGVLPLLAGLGVALFVEGQSGQECSIKWPNDVLVAGRKISGVLCEGKADRLFVGLGVNCRQEEFSHFPKLEATSLRQIGASRYEPLDLLQDLLQSLKTAFGADDPLERIQSMLYLRGRCIEAVTGLPGSERLIRGTLAGLGQDGQLLLEVPESGEMIEVYSGEIRVDQEFTSSES